MKSLIVLISLSVVSFIAQGQEHQLVCKKVVGCPIVNGTCPTCEPIMNTPGRITNKEIDEWGKRMREEMKYDYSSLENDDPSERQIGWEWDGPTWKGLRVLN